MGSSGILCVCGWRGACICVCVCACTRACTNLAVHVNEMKFSEFSILNLVFFLLCGTF